MSKYKGIGIGVFYGLFFFVVMKSVQLYGGGSTLLEAGIVVAFIIPLSYLFKCFTKGKGFLNTKWSFVSYAITFLIAIVLWNAIL